MDIKKLAKDAVTISESGTFREAIQLMIKAIDNFVVEGVQTTLPFGKFVCEHEAFVSGNFDTHFVKNYYSPEKLLEQHNEEAEIAALIALKQYLEDQQLLQLPN